MEIFKILLIIFCFSETPFVSAFTQYSFNAQGKPAPKSELPKLDTVTLEEFVTIASMFPDCNLYIISPGTHISDLDAVSQPRIYYTDLHQYFMDYFLIAGPGTPFMPGAVLVWYLASKRSCKAEIAFDWIQAPAGRTLFPRQLIQDFFTLEPQVDSNFIYQVLISSPGARYPRSMYSWDYMNPSHATFRRVISRAARGRSYNYIKYMYIFRFSKKMLDTAGKINGGPPCPPLSSYEVAVMQTCCLGCRKHSAVTITRKKVEAQTELRKFAIFSKQYGTVATHEWAFRQLKRQATVSIFGLAIETGIYFDKQLQLAVEEPFLLKPEAYETDMERREEGRQILTRALGLMMPESLLTLILMQKFSNSTFKFVGDRKRGDGELLFDGSADIIYGPGIPPSLLDRFRFATYAPVGTSRLRFLTCSNITETPTSGLLYKPFDRSTWTFLWISIGTVCIVLQLTLKNRRNLANLLALFFMVVRILLDNFQDISSKLKKWPTAFAIAVASMALCAITLTNGYRGVLTSDLVMAPGISGPKTFRDLLDDGEWNFIPYYDSRVLKASKRMLGTQANMFHILDDLIAEYESEYSFTNGTLKSSRMTSLTKAEYFQITKSSSQNFRQIQDSGVFHCPCDKGAFITLETNLVDLSLPPTCMQKLDHTNFVFGTDYLAPRTLQWSCRWERPGPVWESLGRLVLESGLYGWVNTMLRQFRGNLKVVGEHVEVANKPNVEVALHMRSLIVQSTFSVWCWMMLASVATFFGEGAVYWCRASFSFR